MAAPDDDIERLLAEVEAALEPTKAAQPAKAAPSSAPDTRGSSSRGADGGPLARVRDGVPMAVATGAVSGAAVWVLFSVLPFVSAFDGGLGAFLAGAAVSLAGRLRRR